MNNWLTKDGGMIDTKWRNDDDWKKTFRLRKFIFNQITSFFSNIAMPDMYYFQNSDNNN